MGGGSEQKGHRLYILGKPGAGKTTFLKYLVHQTVQEKLGRIPIFVTLKDWADKGGDLLTFIARQFDICQFPDAAPFIEYLLETGHAVLLLDGLDEVNLEEGVRDQLMTDLRDFCRKYDKTKAILTCRVAATDYSFTDFTYVEMADFDDGQMTAYARNWFRKSGKADPFLQEFQKPDNEGVRDLGRSPLLLSLICLAYDTTLHIPQRRVELYEEALDALLKKWDAERNIRRDEIYKHLSLGHKRKLFAALASKAFEKGDIFFHKRQLVAEIESFLQKLPAADLKDDPDGEAVLKAIEAQHSILTERAHHIYAFSHLTFQEYYTAKAIVDNARHGTLDALIPHLTDPRWREVFLLTASLLDEANDFFDILHRAIGDLLRGDENLWAMQAWVERKAAQVEELQFGATRGVYWFFVLTRARVSALFNDRDLTLTFARDFAFMFARDFVYDFHHAFVLAYELAHAIVDALDRALAFDLNLTLAHILVNNRSHPALALSYSRDLAITRALARDLDLDRTRTRDNLPPRARHGVEKIFLDTLLLYAPLYTKILAKGWTIKEVRALYPDIQTFFRAVSQASQAADPAFAIELEKTPLPAQESNPEAWAQFDQAFRALALKHRDMGHEWELNKEQTTRVDQYLKATHLLLDCLEVATVNDRQGILDRILTVE
ncbi:MAG: NACHT domain-containing protein [Anaerolineales bacterium]|nr:NACHT domain-containing protein [Anaerolineales bacterium]